MRLLEGLLTVLLTAGCAWGQTSVVLKTEVVATPVKTSRVFQTGLAPNSRGGWNFIAQCMNYKFTTGREKVTLPLDNGQHYLTYADSKSRPDAEWVILDLAAGTHKVVKRPGFHAAEIGAGGLAGNGRIFFGVDYGHIYYYDPTEETVKILGRLNDSIDVLRQFYKLERGPDGMIYGASQSGNGLACVVRINPDTLEWKLITDVGLPGRRGLTYGYYIAMEPPWLYVAVGQGKWELCAVNFDTGEKRVLAQRDGTDSRVTVSQGSDFCTASLSGEPGQLKMALRDGRIVSEAKPGEAFQAPPTPKTYPPLEWKASKPVSANAPRPELDHDRRVAISADGTGALFWRAAATGDWREARFTIENTEPALIESLTLLPDGSILGSAQQYHGWFRYHPAAKRCDYLGKGGPSGAKTVVAGGKMYYAGYPNTTLFVYDPAKPWGKPNAGAPGEAGVTNPVQIGSQGQGRSEAHHAMAMDAVGDRVYTLGLRERWSTGSGLCCYNTATKEFTALGQANKDLDPVHLLAMPKLDRVIVSGAKKDAKLLVYDLNLKEVDQIEIRKGLENTGYMLPVSDTCFLGWYGNPTVTNTTLYLYDLPAKKILKSIEIEGLNVWVTRRAADNTFWALRDQSLARLDPITLELKWAGTLDRELRYPVMGGSSSHRGRPLWIGKELYGASEGLLVKSAAIE
jgi:hypothetical protein